MSKEIVYKKDVLDLISMMPPEEGITRALLIQSVTQLPPAQPERNRGKWIVTSKFEDCYYAKCSECKVTQVFYYNKALTNYCPNCGAAQI